MNSLLLICACCCPLTLDDLPEIKRLFNGTRDVNFHKYAYEESSYHQFLKKIQSSKVLKAPNWISNPRKNLNPITFSKYAYLVDEGNSLKYNFYIPTANNISFDFLLHYSFTSFRYHHLHNTTQISTTEEIENTARQWFRVYPTENISATY